MADATQREILCFQRTNRKDHKGKECLAPCPFKFVEFDGKPDRYLVPINHSPQMTLDYTPIDPVGDGLVSADIEIFDSLLTPWNHTQEFHFV